jgi:hypothetical protein
MPSFRAVKSYSLPQVFANKPLEEQRCRERSRKLGSGDIRTHSEGSGGGPVLDASPDNREQIERGNELTEESGV